jgi:alpha(1,3/1,4) fucosyltransferase
MIWSLWNGIEGKKFFEKFNLYKKKKIKDYYNINDIFLATEKIYSFALKKKIQLVFLDEVKNLEEVDLFIFFDMPNFENELIKKIKKYKKKAILLMIEGKDIYPRNFKREYHKYFKFIFTWNDNLVNNKKYFKFYWGVKNSYYYKTLVHKNKLLCMINSNRIINYEKTMYSLRLNIIKWLDKNYLNNFDLYGFGWNKRFFYSKFKLIRLINRISFITNFFGYRFKCYKGTIKPMLKDKIHVLRKYKFSIVIENSLGPDGWITEKIFHCFFSSTVPIYLGPENIKKYIPSKCFVNIRNFKKIEDAINFAKNMSDVQYQEYINNINEFLKSKKYQKFDIDYNMDIFFKKLKVFNKSY